MKITPTHYAEALYRAASAPGADVATTVTRFIALVRHNRDGKRIRSILSAFEDVSRDKSGRIVAMVETKRSLTGAEKKHIERYITTAFGVTRAEVEYRENKTLKGGIIIKTKNEMLDGSVVSRIKKITRVIQNS